MDVNIDQLCAKFVELRDRRTAIEKQAETDKAKLTKIMDAIEDKIKAIMHEQGTTSLRTPTHRLHHPQGICYRR